MPNEMRPYEVTTVTSRNGVANKFLGKYIVAATSPGHAARAIKLADGEEVLQATELRQHKMVIAR